MASGRAAALLSGSALTAKNENTGGEESVDDE
jgi:hypothetical protein